MKKGTKQLSGQFIIKVSRLFKEKKWEIEDSGEAGESLFNRYCHRMLDIGENKKRELMLELTERYLWIPYEEYEEYLINTLNLLIKNNVIDENKKIYVMPLVAPNDIGKVKSSMLLSYLFNSVKLRHNKNLSKYKFQLEHEYNNLGKKLNEKEARLLLVDDFIGTGETAEKCILHIQKQDITLDKIIVLSLVAQEQGIKYLEKYNIPIVSSAIINKGISDHYVGEELNEKIKLMKDIENRMSIKKEFRFGYNGSEALVTMCRTPNNTFPLFWSEEGNMKSAPFPRD